MAIKRQAFAALAALALAGGITATTVHGTTANADGPVLTSGGGSSGSGSSGGGPSNGGSGGSGTACIYPFDAE
jgi:uncharacterized membrane protein YgcG